MGQLKGWLQGAALLLGSVAATAQANYSQHPEAQRWIEAVSAQGTFERAWLEQTLAEAKQQQSILEAIARPAEKTLTWADYRPIFMTDKRIAQGAKFWQEHAQTLARAEAEYGVPTEYIVAIIGVETFYGRIKGNYRVIDALATLGFDYPPRGAFFRGQLEQFLLMSREQAIDPAAPTGSYAGAMGYPQFIPGSFRAYAVDFDGDGTIDIWNNPVDAIGSVANYFKQHGWQAGAPVTVRARVSGARFAEGVRDKLDLEQQAAELTALGWQPLTALADDTPVRGLRLEGAHGAEYWVALNNFYVITRYNRSSLYAMAVNQLAEALAAQQMAHRG